MGNVFMGFFIHQFQTILFCEDASSNPFIFRMLPVLHQYGRRLKRLPFRLGAPTLFRGPHQKDPKETMKIELCIYIHVLILWYVSCESNMCPLQTHTKYMLNLFKEK